MRTDKDEKHINFIYEELKKGRLRQGWGYQENQDLKTIYSRKKEKTELDDRQKECWKRFRKMYPEEDGIQKGDYLLLPNLPQIGQWSIAKVTGGYRFEIAKDHNDYGHILEVELLNPKTPINPYSKYVSAELRKTAQCQGVLWNIDWYKKQMEELVSAVNKGKDIITTVPSIEKMLNIHLKTLNALDKQMRFEFRGAKFEEPVKRLLKAMYGNENVERRAGPKEKGADFICTLTDKFQIPYKIVVQVKMWEGEIRDLRPLKQIEESYSTESNVSAGVILTTANSVEESFERKRKELEGKLNIPIIVTTKENTWNLFLKYLPEISGNLGAE